MSNIFCLLFYLYVAVTLSPGRCDTKVSLDDRNTGLPEFLSELELTSLDASEKDVETLKKIAKRLAPEKNGEYQVYQVFFGNEDLLKEWLKGAGVSGQPGVDFPTFTTIPATSFSCRGLKGGYYADLETNCQVFHICDNGRKISFLCPNGTIFQQSQLICDWWFKVDCSKSAELYEQSAEQLAEEERKRSETKKKSGLHRPTHNNAVDFHSPDYDGRQNGRTNPFSQSARPNQIHDDDSDDVKAPNQFKQANSFDQNINTRTGNQYSQAANSNAFQTDEKEQETFGNYDQKRKQGSNFNYRTINRQQNQLIDTQSTKYSNREESDKFQENNQDNLQDYYGSSGSQNVARNERPTSRTSKSRSFSRSSNNFNTPGQKTTPLYTETTTFRTTTSSPVKEYQQLAESAAFVSNRGGGYYRSGDANRHYYYQPYNQVSYSANGNQEPDAKNKENQPVLRARFSIPPFPGPTFAPIYKPRTTTVATYETTLQDSTTVAPDRIASTTNYDRQGYKDYAFETTYSSVDETTTRVENEDYRVTGSTSSYSDEYQYKSEAPVYYSTNADFTTPSSDANYYNTNDYDRNRVTGRDTSENTAIYSTPSPYGSTENYYTNTENNVTRDYTENTGTTAPGEHSYVANENDGSQKAGKSGQTINRQSEQPSKSSQSHFRNWVNSSTQKYSATSKTLSPYDTSFTYKQGKVMSTLGPYVPFTKNYGHSGTTAPSTTTFKPAVYNATVPSYTSTHAAYRTPKTFASRTKQVSSSGSDRSKITQTYYFPESQNKISLSNLETRPATEKEHVLSMLHSLQGLEKDVRVSGVSRSNVPTSSGPSTLHSLALYFATASENFDSKESTDASVSNEQQEVTEQVPTTEKIANVSVELPKGILTQQTVTLYEDLFKLNNALEGNATNEEAPDDVNDSNNNDDVDDDDLDIQQSEGPVNGANRSNGTKLRELAQVFTHALSAYLQDPGTFKKVLKDIRPTEPPATTESDQLNDVTSMTTSYPTTVDEYPSVTKEKDEVLDFSEDVNGSVIRKQTTLHPSKSHYSTINENLDESTTSVTPDTRRDFYTTLFAQVPWQNYNSTSVAPAETYDRDAYTTAATGRQDYYDSGVQPLEQANYQTTTWPLPASQNNYYGSTVAAPIDEINYSTTTQLSNDLYSNEYYESSTVPTDSGDFAHKVNDAFGASNDNRSEAPNESPRVLDDYFPVQQYANDDGSTENTTYPQRTSEPYGKYVKPVDATPINNNYVPSSTPRYYGEYAETEFTLNDKSPKYNAWTSNKEAATKVSNSIIGNSKFRSTTAIPKRSYAQPEAKQPFRIRYYDSRTPDESLITSRSSYQTFRNNYNHVESSAKVTERPITTLASTRIRVQPITTSSSDTEHVSREETDEKNATSNSLGSDHWTSSPMVTQLWESTVFIDPKRINHGLEGDATSKEFASGSVESVSTSFPKEISRADASSEATKSSSWKWTSNEDSPTTFSLLPNVFSSENTATPTPIYTTRSSITTTITSSVSSSNAIPRDNLVPSLLSYSIAPSTVNATTADSEITKAKRMFGNLNESSSNTLMNVMKQADKNETVRRLVLLLIKHCNGSLNKSMEEEKEQLLNALLRMPVNQFTSEESRQIVAGINRLSLPYDAQSDDRLGRSDLRLGTSTAPPRSSDAPAVTTFRSRKGRKFRTTTKTPPVISRRSDSVELSEGTNTLADKEIATSDGRALELLRSLYTVAAKWG